MDGVTLFGLGLIVGGLGLLATAAVGLGRRYVIFDGRVRSRRPRRPVRPRTSPPVRRPGPPVRRVPPDRGLPPQFRTDPSSRTGNRSRSEPPTRADLPVVAGRNARAGQPRPRESNQPRRPVAQTVSSALLADTVQLQRVPAWSEPARNQRLDPHPPGGG